MEKIDWSKAPEGATHAGMNQYGSLNYFYNLESKVADYEYWNVILDDDKWHIGRGIPAAQPIIPHPSPAWSGEGLPPVGVVCELHIKDDRWETCEVIAHDQQDGERVAVVRYGAGYYGGDTECLRPIRTPEQIAADEREAAINEIGNLIASVGPTFRDQATRLYDAGYRKQEQPK